MGYLGTHVEDNRESVTGAEEKGTSRSYPGGSCRNDTGD